MLDKEYYKDYCERFNTVYNWLKNKSIDSDKVLKEICNLRGYDINRMGSIIKKSGFLKLSGDVETDVLSKKKFSDLGLYSDGRFLLQGRYIFPVRDMIGNIIALIGWYPDSKRYITSKSALFSKGGLFFGMEQLGETGIGKNYFITEGIFDSLSLRALGFNAVAQMGINSSENKKVLYGLFKRVVAIPDTDEEGLKVLKKDSWGVPVGSSYMSWSETGKVKRVKDIDDFCKKFDEDTLKSIFEDVLTDETRIITFKI